MSSINQPPVQDGTVSRDPIAPGRDNNGAVKKGKLRESTIVAVIKAIQEKGITNIQAILKDKDVLANLFLKMPKVDGYDPLYIRRDNWQKWSVNFRNERTILRQRIDAYFRSLVENPEIDNEAAGVLPLMENPANVRSPASPGAAGEPELADLRSPAVLNSSKGEEVTPKDEPEVAELRVASCLINVTRSLEIVEEPQNFAGEYLPDRNHAPSMRFSNSIFYKAPDGRLINFQGLCSLNCFLHMLLDLKEKGFDAFIKILLQLTTPALRTILHMYNPPNPLPLFSESLRAELVARSFETLTKSKQEAVLNDPRVKKAEGGDLKGYGTNKFVSEWLDTFDIVCAAQTEECCVCHSRHSVAASSLSLKDFRRILKLGRTKTRQTRKRCILTLGCHGTMMSQAQISPRGFIVSCPVKNSVAIDEGFLIEEAVPKSCIIQGVRYALTNIAIDTYTPGWEEDDFSGHAMVISFDQITGQPKSLNDNGISRDFRARGFFGRLELAVYTAAPIEIAEHPTPNIGAASAVPPAGQMEERSLGRGRSRRKNLLPLGHAELAGSSEKEQPHKMLTRAAARRLQQK